MVQKGVDLLTKFGLKQNLFLQGENKDNEI